MCPEYGATVAIFPIDAMTIDYLRLTGRDEAAVALVEAYARAQGLFADEDAPEADVQRGDRARPRQRRAVARRAEAAAGPRGALGREVEVRRRAAPDAGRAEEAGGAPPAAAPEGPGPAIDHGAVVVAAITSCTNTSNPSVLVAAGLLAKKAVERGLTRKPWVKTSLAPGSKVVTEYLEKAGLATYLDALGFNLVGYGCTTCIGNSGPLPEDVAAQIEARGLIVASVLSGNRNFEGRVQPLVRANYLASPPLVVAYALAGTMALDLTTEPLGTDTAGAPVYLKDIWPTEREIQECIAGSITAEMYRERVRGRLRGRRAVEGDRAPGRRPLRVGRRVDLRPEPAVLRRAHARTAAAPAHRRRPRAGGARRQHHDRPHLTGRQHQGRQPGREVPAGARRAAEATSTSTARGAATTK